ncbi:rho guanine nucleotide exchange factor 39 isoform 2-T2 [Anomaloglossus baeobatrachus]|uniref:rho guanine nucleotide exchange factor 39 isoform X2 n=1 Tax=Anomaloglossus baeobatrachus TaxID=238106 RepID=UPI003F505D20
MMESPLQDQRRRWERKRGRTARELLETERTYVEELELITKFYDEVFRARCGHMKLAQEGICGTIPSIVKVNRSLLISLEHNMTSSGFHDFSHYLHLYKKHADCIGATKQALQVQITKKKSFSRFMKLQESRPELQGRTLEKLLELPLHRAMRYRHYLQDLVENTFPGSSDSTHLNGALLAVSDVCDHIENLQMIQENDLQLRRVQRLLKGRRIRILSPAPCHPLHPVNAHKFCCRAVYPLRECRVEKVLGHTQSQGGLISLSFRREKLLFMSSNQQDMNAWYESLVTAVRKLHAETSRQTRPDAPHLPIMTEIQNAPAARAPKRHHVDLPVDFLHPKVSQDDPLCKRLKTSELRKEEDSQPAMSDEGSGWKCMIL